MSWRHVAMAVSLAGVTLSMATPALAQTWSARRGPTDSFMRASWAGPTRIQLRGTKHRLTSGTDTIMRTPPP